MYQSDRRLGGHRLSLSMAAATETRQSSSRSPSRHRLRGGGGQCCTDSRTSVDFKVKLPLTAYRPVQFGCLVGFRVGVLSNCIQVVDLAVAYIIISHCNHLVVMA
jgi:hypothetical protein